MFKERFTRFANQYVVRENIVLLNRKKNMFQLNKIAFFLIICWCRKMRISSSSYLLFIIIIICKTLLPEKNGNTCTESGKF